MAQNYVLLERIELTASAASVTFSNIPQSGYTDLKIVMSARSNRASVVDNIRLSINGSGYSTNITNRTILGDGSSASSYSVYPEFAGGLIPGASATANTFNNNEIYFPNYNSSTTNKSFSTDSVTENNGTTAYAILGASLYSSTSPITSIAIIPDIGTAFVQYSTFSLYGLAAVGTTPAIAPKATGGNIATDGTYWYHTFLASGTFTPATALSCDALVVAGGGGGGQTSGGGGGAGGLLGLTSQSFSTSSYTVTIGAGGAGSTTTSQGVNGVNSSITGLTAAVGGGGGGTQGGTNTGATGGSGGGGSYSSGSGGSATSGQGYAGGRGSANGGSGGGGGGAGAVGGQGLDGSPYTSGAGGTGLNTYSSWASATNTGVSGYYAGGGGGGNNGNPTRASGGAGGGGLGRNASSAGSDATINTGSGGGGGGDNTAGYAGGSGIVIIRYAI
jgi:hypothetical protein